MIDTLRDEIVREYVVETEGWAFERAARVDARLQRDVPAALRLATLVVWSDAHTAFTALGHTIYVSRRLFELMPDDDAAAFVIAHELAHHDLGHVPAVDARWLPARVAIALLSRVVCRPGRELDADLRAIELCMRAGYDADRCVHALEILAKISLDYRDLDGVFGGARRSHAPLEARIAAVRTHAAQRSRAGA